MCFSLSCCILVGVSLGFDLISSAALAFDIVLGLFADMMKIINTVEELLSCGEK